MFLRKSFVVSIRIALITMSLVVGGSSTLAQDISATHTVSLDPQEFNLGAINPAIDLRSKVFDTGLRFTIKQWSDGSLTYAADSRVEMINLQTGETSAVSATIGAVFKAAGKIGVKVAEITSGMDFSTLTTLSHSLTSSQGWVKKNAIELKIENNLVSAIVTYMVDNVLCVTEVPLGVIQENGIFKQFETGSLAGKAIIADPEGRLTGYVSEESAPATANPLLRNYGVVNRYYDYKAVWVLTGWFVTTGTINGQVVSVRVEPEYELRLVPYQSFSLTVQRGQESQMAK